MKIVDKKNIKGKVEIITEKEKVILKSIYKPRKNWETAFKRMRKENDDRLLINDFFEEEILEDSDFLTL
jgi:antitoxin MazE